MSIAFVWGARAMQVNLWVGHWKREKTEKKEATHNTIESKEKERASVQTALFSAVRYEKIKPKLQEHSTRRHEANDYILEICFIRTHTRSSKNESLLPMSALLLSFLLEIDQLSSHLLSYADDRLPRVGFVLSAFSRCLALESINYSLLLWKKREGRDRRNKQWEKGVRINSKQKCKTLTSVFWQALEQNRRDKHFPLEEKETRTRRWDTDRTSNEIQPKVFWGGLSLEFETLVWRIACVYPH